MNIFHLQAVVAHIELPESADRNGLMVVETGKAKARTNKPVQSVSQRIIRIPGRLLPHIRDLRPGSAVEVVGRMQGKLKRTPDHLNIMSCEMISERIFPAQMVSDEDAKEGLMENSFLMSGVLLNVEPPEEGKQGGRVYLQYGPSREDQKRMFEYVNVVQITVYGNALREAEKISPKTPVSIKGYVNGLMKEVPGSGDGFLEAELIGVSVTKSCMASRNIFSKPDQRKAGLKAVN